MAVLKYYDDVGQRYVDLPGLPGAQGPQGPAGAAGTNGANGAAGTPGFNDYDSQVILDGAIRYWPMSDRQSPAFDVVAALNATLNGTVTPGQSSPFGTCMGFDGSSGYAVTSPSQVAPPTIPFSEEIWYRSSGTGTAALGMIGLETAIPNTPAPGSFGFALWLVNNGLLTTYQYPAQISDTAPSNDGAWHHAVVVVDGTNVTLYRDGVQVAQAAQTSVQNYNGFWKLGCTQRRGGAGPGYFPGQLCRAALYSKALTPAQIQNHYNVRYGLPGPQGPPGTPGSGGGGSPIARKSLDWFFPFMGGLGTIGIGNQNQLYAWPWLADSSFTLAQVGWEVTTAPPANTTVNICIYADDGTGRPGAKLWDSGASAAEQTTGVKYKTVTPGLAITKGTLYWIATCPQVGSFGPTVRAIATYFAIPIVPIYSNGATQPSSLNVSASFGVIKPNVSTQPMPDPFGASQSETGGVGASFPPKFIFQAA